VSIKIDAKFSNDMHLFTEKVGTYLPLDAHKIIKHRYLIATKLSKGKRALEVGVGQGFGIQSIAKASSKYTGIEYSSENLAYINNIQSKYKIIHGDAHNMPFDESEFQIINALAMIYYLDVRKFFKEVKRVLSIGGTLFFCTSNKDAPGFVKAPHTKKYYSIPELNNMLISNGFEVKFYGSFIRYDHFKSYGNFKVIIKNFVKRLIITFPNGKYIWSKMRNKYLGGIKKLPSNMDYIELDDPWENNFNILENTINNSQYRVIYCIAKLKKK
jgi:ubiquinone/menaquinone biosynthesis C-methylase UbiE